MTTLDGMFSMRTTGDLVGKLEADFNRLASADPDEPEAQYAAYDFFVTAEHIPDWIKHTSGGSLTSHRSYPDGSLVSHIASGAKHFHVTNTRHKTASDTEVVGAFDPAAFDSDAFDVRRLVIKMDDGSMEDVLNVAGRVLKHWRDELKRR